MMRETTAHLKSSVVTIFLCVRPSAGDSDAYLDELYVTGLIGPQGSRGQVAAMNHQRQGDHSYCNGQHRQSNVHDGLTCNGQHRQNEFLWWHDLYGPLVLANKSRCFQA